MLTTSGLEKKYSNLFMAVKPLLETKPQWTPTSSSKEPQGGTSLTRALCHLALARKGDCQGFPAAAAVGPWAETSALLQGSGTGNSSLALRSSVSAPVLSALVLPTSQMGDTEPARRVAAQPEMGPAV